MTVSWKRTLLALLIFGTAFGYLEAAVVTYLRLLHAPEAARFHPGRTPDDLFPLLTLDQIHALGPRTTHTLVTEVGREVATIVMIAAIALAVARNAGEWGAAFVIVFGVWDITFYVFLKVLIDWPASLMTWDILFLVPVPWVGPVLSPCLVSAAMIAAGVWHLLRPVHLAGVHWCGILAGAAILIAAFAMDYPNTMAGGMPNPFHWGIFAIGLGLGLASYSAAHRTRAVANASAKAAAIMSE